MTTGWSCPREDDQPVAGPSRLPITSATIHPKFTDIDNESNDSYRPYQNPMGESEVDEPSDEFIHWLPKHSKCPPPVTDTLDDDRQNRRLPGPQPKRRPAEPTGRFFDPPCSRCKLKHVRCEIGASHAACVRCYLAKNKCDYGQHRVQKKWMADSIAKVR